MKLVSYALARASLSKTLVGARVDTKAGGYESVLATRRLARYDGA